MDAGKKALLIAGLLLGIWSSDAQAQCAGADRACNDALMHNVILPQQQRAAEAAAQTPLPPPPHPMEAMREQAEA